jgi:hypothetical protein
MRFVALAVVLLFSATIQCYASPMLYGESIAQIDLVSKAIERAVKIFSIVQGATKSVLQKQDITLASFSPNRKLMQNPPSPSAVDPNTCAGSPLYCSNCGDCLANYRTSDRKPIYYWVGNDPTATLPNSLGQCVQRFDPPITGEERPVGSQDLCGKRVFLACSSSLTQSIISSCPSPSPNPGPSPSPNPDPSQYTCESARSSLCTQPSDALLACMRDFSDQAQSGMQKVIQNPLGLGSLFCAYPSCSALIINFLKTCACIDFQPLYDISCPSSPTASECSKNPYVQKLVSLSADPEDSLFHPEQMMMFAELVPNPTKPFDFSQCGNSSVYKRTVLINGLGSCLDPLIAAFPIPTFMQDKPVQGMERVTYKQMMTSSLKCFVTAPSFLLQALCSGNVGKCYSAASLVPSCNKISPSQCSSACRTDLAQAGAVDSVSPAKCCVKWFQDQATAPACSTTPTLTLPTLMGADCVNFIKMASQASPQPIPDAMFTQPILPAPCPARSSASLSVANCAVTTPLAAACSADTSTPYVQSSLFVPKRTSTATITFTSRSLKAVRAVCFALWHLSCSSCAGSWEEVS